MTDFLYSTAVQPGGALARQLQEIFRSESLGVREIHGAWGSLGISQSRYTGFDAVETDTHVCVVIGGPVLYFERPQVAAGRQATAGTRAILDRWCAGEMDWSVDLSGPFVVLIIDKGSGEAVCVTDLLMFIPVYKYCKGTMVMLGTHVDVMARACGEDQLLDDASLVDFVLHDVVTFPYTCYRNVFQCSPAALHRVAHTPDGCVLSEARYWTPRESESFSTLGEAACALNVGVRQYVDRVTAGVDRVAQFISAGEDSRVVAGMLGKSLRRDAFIFLDSMNREGVIARSVALKYGARINVGFRDSKHYLTILGEAARLVGSGHQYRHSHALGFDRQYRLAAYPAVFGGYLSDTLLKAEYARKPALLGRLKFFPQWRLDGETRSDEVKSLDFPVDLLAEITGRRREHLGRVREFRPQSSHEWFELWPMTMRAHISNLYSNRRLFASYEPFMSKEVVKISASVPVGWKLNRRLFHKAFRSYLAGSKWVRHSDGRLPYFPWWVNVFIQTPVWLTEKVAQRVGLQSENQGPWGDWKHVLASSEWENEVEMVCADRELAPVLRSAVEKQALRGGMLTIGQRVNLLQCCVQFGQSRS